MCDVCGATDELKDWKGADGKMYFYCRVCWFDVCDTIDELEAMYCLPDDHSLHTCDNCDSSVNAPEPKRQALECQDCKKVPATHTFNHLDGRSFNLCSYCWQLADHEDDYGADFGSTPNLRKTGQARLCECPLPCDLISPTRCELCKGIVVLLRDE